MELLCIREGIRNLPVWPEVGSVYTMVRVVPSHQLFWNKESGKIFIELAELGKDYCYDISLFSPFTNLDEQELLNEKEEVYA